MLSLSQQAFYMSIIGRLYNIVFVVTNTCPDETKRAFPLKSISKRWITMPWLWTRCTAHISHYLLVGAHRRTVKFGDNPSETVCCLITSFITMACPFFHLRLMHERQLNYSHGWICCHSGTSANPPLGHSEVTTCSELLPRLCGGLFRVQHAIWRV